MQRRGFIAQAEIESDSDFIVYGPTLGAVARCPTLAAAERALREKLAEAHEWNMTSDLSVFRWLHGGWIAVVDPYEIQRWEVDRNPSRVIRFI
jgi:hypothetical protein